MQPRKPNLVREIMAAIPQSGRYANDLAIVFTRKLTQLVNAKTKLILAIAAFVAAVIKLVDLLK